jgi:Mor family transcriptional regulator
MSANLDRVATFLRDLADILTRAARAEFGVAPDRAAEFGLSTAQKACDEFRGQLIYVPIGLALRISERDQAMFEEYCRNGRDAAAVAKKFDVSVPTAYKRVKIVETALFNERQGGLFPEDAE